MSYNTVPELLTGIGNAIREKTNTSNKINAQDMPNLIKSIKTTSTGTCILTIKNKYNYDYATTLYINNNDGIEIGEQMTKTYTLNKGDLTFIKSKDASNCLKTISISSNSTNNYVLGYFNDTSANDTVDKVAAISFQILDDCTITVEARVLV